MNKINRKLEYALMALRHLHLKKPGELASVKEMSSLYGCPYDLTARVLQQLARGGVVRSEHGAQGGYQLVKDLTKLSMQDLMQLVLGPVELAKCLGSERCELVGSCNIQTPMQNLQARLSLFYQSISVADLFAARTTRPRAEASPYG